MNSEDIITLKDLWHDKFQDKGTNKVINTKDFSDIKVPKNLTGLLVEYSIEDNEMTWILREFLIADVPIGYQSVKWFQNNRFASTCWLTWDSDLRALLWISSDKLHQYTGVQPFGDIELFKEHVFHHIAQQNYNQYKEQ